ncbi:unnamed protein product [Chilo suppressalis]|uniref:Sulfatase N-terminal domain-containing protein n=1 Tax=Chilo suppressalis TaxID=168631 RepID=A0ABN8BDT9_CHISP|nr:unnamed protein product [Chilo suppressalis]
MKVYLCYLLLIKTVSNAKKYLIDTPGCRIPDFNLTIPDLNKRIACGERKVFVEKINDYDVIFTITENLQNCCYKFIKTEFYNDFFPSHGVEYTKCEPISSGGKVKLKSDFIFVKCNNYEDIYGFTKKIRNIKHKHQKRYHWNVLVLGLDRTSRMRAYNSLEGTINYLQQDNWLDFRGYNKVGLNTYPNLVQVLTGKNESFFEKSCHMGMSECNHLMVWSEFKKAGYVTAYGEDSIYLPDTFYRKKGYRKSPTDHFMRPLFKACEKEVIGTVCSEKLSSGEQILNYITDFVQTYRDENLFGFFWISSFSHNENHLIRNFDSALETFFRNLANIENTFIIFFSDHGMRYGEQKKHVESFYEDRLPMLFIRVPHNLEITFPQLYSNLRINQERLISPKDLHLTLVNLINRKNSYTQHPKLEGCPKCQSLFQRIPIRRTCSDAGIPDYFCACRVLTPTSMKEYGAMYSVIQLIVKIHNTSRNVRTTRCTYCEALSIKEVLRSHYYKIKNVTYYLFAFTMTPGDIGFEGLVSKNQDYKYKIMYPINPITTWRVSGACALHPSDRAYCVCKKKHSCNTHRRRLVVKHGPALKFHQKSNPMSNRKVSNIWQRKRTIIKRMVGESPFGSVVSRQMF